MSERDELSRIILAEGLKGATERSLKQACDDTADAILARYNVVELPTLSEPDDDGQIYLDSTWDRIDVSVSGKADFFTDDGAHISARQLRRRAAEYLAAARLMEAQS